MSSELFAFFRRHRTGHEEIAFESTPEESIADASHLTGLEFNASSRKDWLKVRQTPEEDRVGEQLRQFLHARGPLPAHSPAWGSPEEAQLLQKLAALLQQSPPTSSFLDGTCNASAKQTHQPMTTKEEVKNLSTQQSYQALAAKEGSCLDTWEAFCKVFDWHSFPNMRILKLPEYGPALRYTSSISFFGSANEVLASLLSEDVDSLASHEIEASELGRLRSQMKIADGEYNSVALMSARQLWAVGFGSDRSESSDAAKFALALAIAYPHRQQRSEVALQNPPKSFPAFWKMVDYSHSLWMDRCQRQSSFFDFDELESDLSDALASGATSGCPRPSWLTEIEGVVNIAVTGQSGVGKSSLINAIRRSKPGSHGWAPVGVTETTMEPTMYVFPTEQRIRLWDLPGAGTVDFPLATYMDMMGLRYFDYVLLVTSGRFTSTELSLSSNLESHRVPYVMIRTKTDFDVRNNQEDNRIDEATTISVIREDLKHRGVSDPYVVAAKEPWKYDFIDLIGNVLPGLKELFETSHGPEEHDWVEDQWALPGSYSKVLSRVQGEWRDSRAFYVIEGSAVHVTQLHGGACAELSLVEEDGCLVWNDHWYVDEAAAEAACRTRKLNFKPLETISGKMPFSLQASCSH